MPITSVTSDPEELTLTFVAEFSVPVHRLWDAYADPRQVERFWGPPDWPATFLRHDHFVGGRSHYFMTGPDGEQSHGLWNVLAVDEGRSFLVEDGFAGEDGLPNPAMPSMRLQFTFDALESGSRLVSTTYFNSVEERDQLLQMGAEEGARAAMAQIDAVLADQTAAAADHGTEAQLLTDTQVRLSRVLRGAPQQVWDAHNDPELLRRWLFGPDGWRLAQCHLAHEPGDDYRFAWAPEPGVEGQPFAFTGELKESEPPRRAVTTEQMEGMPGSPTLNEQTFTPVHGGTLLCVVITYETQELRDQILATGMTDGMEASYARLEADVLA